MTNSLAQALTGTEGLIAHQKPKDLYTSMLIKNGLSTAPVGHWTEGVARIAQALMGASELRAQEGDETQRRAAPDEIAAIRSGAVPPSGAPAPGMSMPPRSVAPPQPQNMPGQVAQNDPTMAHPESVIQGANGAQPARSAPPPIAFGDGMVGQPGQLPPPRAASFSDRFGAATGQPPAAATQAQQPQTQPSPAQARPAQSLPNEVSDAEIDAMRKSKNQYTKAYGNELFLNREKERAKLNEPEYGVVGRDQYGYDRRGWIDKRNRTVTPTSPEIPSFVDTKKLRDEVRDLPSYKNLAQAAPVYKSMFDAAGRDNRAADVNLIYGLGKIMDPGSVVRESEMTIAQAVATLPQQLQSSIMSQLNSTGRLSPEVRASIMREAHSRVGAYQGTFDTDMGMYRGIAQSGQFNPAHVIPTFGPFDQFQAAPPPAETPPPAGGRQRTGTNVQDLRKKYNLE